MFRETVRSFRQRDEAAPGSPTGPAAEAAGFLACGSSEELEAAPPRGVWRPRTSLSRPAHRLSFTRAADPLTGSSDGVSEEVSAPQPFERAGRLERAQRSNGRGCRHSHRQGEEAPYLSETGRHRHGCRNDLRASDDESPSAQSVRGSRGMLPLTGTSGMSEVQLNVRFSMFDWYCASRLAATRFSLYRDSSNIYSGSEEQLWSRGFPFSIRLLLLRWYLAPRRELTEAHAGLSPASAPFSSSGAERSS